MNNKENVKKEEKREEPSKKYLVLEENKQDKVILENYSEIHVI